MDVEYFIQFKCRKVNSHSVYFIKTFEESIIRSDLWRIQLCVHLCCFVVADANSRILFSARVYNPLCIHLSVHPTVCITSSTGRCSEREHLHATNPANTSRYSCHDRAESRPSQICSCLLQLDFRGLQAFPACFSLVSFLSLLIPLLPHLYECQQTLLSAHLSPTFLRLPLFFPSR